MVKYIKDMCDAFKHAQVKFADRLIEIKKRSRSSTQLTAAPKNLFVVNEECEPFNDLNLETIHSLVAKALYFAK